MSLYVVVHVWKLEYTWWVQLVSLVPCGFTHQIRPPGWHQIPLLTEQYYHLTVHNSEV